MVTVDFVSEDTNLQTGTRRVGKADRSRETLVVLNVVILQTDLQFNSLGKVTLGLRSIGVAQQIVDSLTNSSSRDFAVKAR